VAKPISDGALQKLAAGLPMMESKTRPARVQRIASRQFRIILKEGKNRQVRRMVRKVGNQVKMLKRIRVAGIKLGQLPTGKWRHLTEKEKEEIWL
jgi:23S rRNA pseudouridine2605 synthase/23S rRNA pseudouridine2604 synthase